MSTEINIMAEKLKENSGTLKNALNEFRSYGKSFLEIIENEMLDSSNCKSDFIEKIKETIGNMKDTKADAVIENLDKYNQYLDDVIELFEKVDDANADAIFQEKVVKE